MDVKDQAYEAYAVYILTPDEGKTVDDLAAWPSTDEPVWARTWLILQPCCGISPSQTESSLHYSLVHSRQDCIPFRSAVQDTELFLLFRPFNVRPSMV